MDTSNAGVFRCGLIARPRDMGWLSDWLVHRQCDDEIVSHALVSDREPGHGPAPAVSGDLGFSLDAVLMLATSDGMAWARGRLREFANYGLPVVVVTRGLRHESIRILLGLGARDFLASNCDRDELRLRLLRFRRMTGPQNDKDIASSSARNPVLARLIGSSPVFVRHLTRIPAMGGCDAAVLILGETGTGKELCAQAIHYLSPRASHPWVAVNCAALPADLIESELFGHLRGAYTGAHQGSAGLISEAQGGTLFLDEIDSMPLAAQAKLLRFLEDKEYRPVGSAKAHHADVRVIAASNDDLAALARDGRFRKDLYYRLNVLTVSLPPLRERLEDLPLLAQHFVDRFALEFKREVSELSAGALARMAYYDWPGNVRELKHTIERAVLLCRGRTIETDDLDLPGEAPGRGSPDSFRGAKLEAVRAFERAYIERILLICHGNITHAAEACGKNRRAFWELIRKHGIDAERYRAG